MKPWIAILLVLAALVSAGAAAAAEQRVTLAVDNMTCAACPVIVKQALAGVDGVRNVHVSYERKTAIVTYDESKVALPALMEASAKAGYPARVKQ